MAMRCRVGRLRPARLERAGSGAVQEAEEAVGLWAGGGPAGKEERDDAVAVGMREALGSKGVVTLLVEDEGFDAGGADEMGGGGGGGGSGGWCGWLGGSSGGGSDGRGGGGVRTEDRDSRGGAGPRRESDWA